MADWWVTGPCAGHAVFVVLVIGLVCVTAGAVRAENAIPPRSVAVLPVFFVPKGEREPSAEEEGILMRHLQWSRTRYRELLGDTFAIAEPQPRVYHSDRDLDYYRAQPEGSAPQFVSELAKAYGYNRYTCPYVMVVVFMNSVDDYPGGGGGRPINGGLNTGGGIVILASCYVKSAPNFQSTLQHELGHAFGLPHVDVYGIDMMTNRSFMSYNPGHHTNGFEPSATPGEVIPEDVRSLAMNHRVFHKLRFDPKKDIPEGYKISERIITLGTMVLPDQPNGVTVTTEAGEAEESKVSNIVQWQILPPDAVFDGYTMWESAKCESGWAVVDVVMPYAADLTRVIVCSGCKDRQGAVRAMRIEVKDQAGKFREVAKAKTKGADSSIKFAKTQGREWRFGFEAGDSGEVILRGMRFFVGDDEVYAPLIVYGG
jgi:hypothetical protein